jgi:hypothetical protein
MDTITLHHLILGNFSSPCSISKKYPCRTCFNASMFLLCPTYHAMIMFYPAPRHAHGLAVITPAPGDDPAYPAPPHALVLSDTLALLSCSSHYQAMAMFLSVSRHDHVLSTPRYNTRPRHAHILSDATLMR